MSSIIILQIAEASLEDGTAEYTGQRKSKSDLGYISVLKRYQVRNCEGCPVKSRCHKSKNNRIIEANYSLNRYKQKVRERLLSQNGIYHRGRRCIEPEAVFAQIKHNSAWNRFRLKGLEKVKVEFTLVAIAHNLKKLAKKAGVLLLFAYSGRIMRTRENIFRKKEGIKTNMDTKRRHDKKEGILFRHLRHTSTCQNNIPSKK